MQTFFIKLLFIDIFFQLSCLKSKQRNCILFHRSYECEMKYIVSIIKIFASHIHFALNKMTVIHLQVCIVLQSYFMFKLLIQTLFEISKLSTISRLKRQLIYDA